MKKKCFYEELFKKIGKNSQLLWNVVNNITCKTSNKTDIMEITHNSATVSDTQDIMTSLINTLLMQAKKSKPV